MDVLTQHIEEKLRVRVSASKLWEILDDFGGIEKYSPTIKTSPIIGDKTSGVGAKRENFFHNGSSMIEEIVEYDDGHRYTMELTEHGMPIKSMIAEMKVESIDAESAEVSMALDFVVKGGPFGWVLGFVMIRPLMRAIFRKQLAGWVYHAATGKLVEDKLPPKDVLPLALAATS